MCKVRGGHCLTCVRHCIARALQAQGHAVGRYLATTLMRETGIGVRRRKRYRVTTNSGHQAPLFANVLARQFQVSAPNRAYVSDMTYIWTREGWLYLTVFVDLFSRRVVGWSMGYDMSAAQVTQALRMAVHQRRPAAGLIVHSDRGAQYASRDYRRLLNAHGLVGSHSRQGDCWDNAVAESFFASLKKERVQWKDYQTRTEARADILNYGTSD